MKRAVMAWVVCVGLTRVWGQTDSPPALPALRIEIPQGAGILDTVWTDTLWQWSGTCPSDRLTLRLTDLNSGYVAQRMFPCAPAQQPASSYVTPQTTDHVLAIELNRNGVAAWTWGVPTTCFPPLPLNALEQAVPSWNSIPFERDQLRAIVEWAASRCLPPDMVRACLLQLESEDRRLELLEALLPHCSQPEAVKIDDLFILRATRAKAAQLLGN